MRLVVDQLVTKPVYHSELAEKVKQGKVLDKQIKKLQKVLATLKADVKEEMGDDTVLYDEDGLELCTYKWANAKSFYREYFDTDYPGVYEQYLIAAPQRKFNFK